MKKILKFTLLISFALVTQNQLWKNLVFEQTIWTIIKVAFILSIFELLLKPIIRILLLPINILTLGLFRIVINTFGFYLAIFLLSDFQVNSIKTASTFWQGINIPGFIFNGFWAFVVSSMSLNILLYFFKLIIKPKREKK